MSALTNRLPIFSHCCITHVTLSLGAKRRIGSVWRDLDLAFTIDPVLPEISRIGLIATHFWT
jgi:hypothetical protein